MTDPITTAVETAAKAEVAAVKASLFAKIYASLQANPLKTLLLSGAAGAIIGFVVRGLI